MNSVSRFCILAVFAALSWSLGSSELLAQQRRREISWVNPDVTKMPGLTHKVLASKTMGHDVGYVVWTPPGFDESGTTKYPVVYFLHGAGGSEKSDAAGFSSIVAKAIKLVSFRVPCACFLTAA